MADTPTASTVENPGGSRTTQNSLSRAATQDIETPSDPAPSGQTQAVPKPKAKKVDKGKGPAVDKTSAGSSKTPKPKIQAHFQAETSVPPPWFMAYMATNDKRFASLQKELRDRSVSRGRSRSSRRDNPSPAPSDPGSSNQGDGVAISEDGISNVSPYADHAPRYRPGKINPLDDGVLVNYYAWKLRVQNTMQMYPLDFKTLTSKLTFIVENTTGLAQERIMTRINEDSALYFQDMDEVWDLLKSTCTKLFEKENAEKLYHDLQMAEGERFVEFLTIFETAAEKAQKALADRRGDLWLKLSCDLRDRSSQIEADHPTYLALTKRLTKLDGEYYYNQATRAKHAAARPAKTKVTPFPRVSASPARVAGGVAPVSRFSDDKAGRPHFVRGVTPARGATPSAEKKDHSSLTCYNCGEVGHISPNCPKPVMVSNIDLKAELAQLDVVSGDSGNESS